MGQYNSPPDFLRMLGGMKKRIQALENTKHTPVYTTATRPSASNVTQGTVIFVTDAAAGSQFQGWSGTTWVSLG